MKHVTRRRPPVSLLLCLALAGCGGDGSEPSVPTTISVSPTTVSFTAVGQTQQLTATVTDQRGDQVTGASVSWTSANSGIAMVSATGLVTAAGQGTTQVTAEVGSLSSDADVDVTQAVTAFQAATGNGQSGGAGQELPIPLTVQASDALGNPIADLVVTFSVTQGNGSVQPGSATTGADGRASTTFTLGSDPASAQQVTASLAASTLVASFSATALFAYDIEIRFLTTPTAGQAQAFADAESRWESLVTGDVPDLQANAPAGGCNGQLPAISELVDDLVIFVRLEPIDGPGNILGAAGPCFIRNPGDFTVAGLMRFDTDDLADLEQAGVLSEVILHEMGHVLGIGTLWTLQGLLVNPALGMPPGVDPHFTGAGAIAAFDAAGGTGYVAGEKVPVEDTGGLGTADSHWRELVLGNELMTGFIAAAGNPLSAITVRSLGDLGYVVNQGGSDPFTFVPALRTAPSGRRWHLANDILDGPIYRMDRSGAVVGVVRR